jgi:hypothetical protein
LEECGAFKFEAMNHGLQRRRTIAGQRGALNFLNQITEEAPPFTQAAQLRGQRRDFSLWIHLLVIPSKLGSSPD